MRKKPHDGPYRRKYVLHIYENLFKKNDVGKWFFNKKYIEAGRNFRDLTPRCNGWLCASEEEVPRPKFNFLRLSFQP